MCRGGAAGPTPQHPTGRRACADRAAGRAPQEKARAKAAELERSREFSVGKYAYERGRYQDAVVALEEALNKEGPFSQLGGDIQMWLALAYQVGARTAVCRVTGKPTKRTAQLVGGPVKGPGRPRATQRQGARCRRSLQARDRV